MSNVRLRKNHITLCRHYLKYSGCEISLSKEDIKAFIEYESNGLGSPHSALLEGKRNYGIFEKSVLEEVFYYWSRGWGWAIPLLDFIDDSFNFDVDEITITKMKNIFQRIEDSGMINFLNSQTGFTDNQKEKWIAGRDSLCHNNM